jgi:serine/threonine protein kinase
MDLPLELAPGQVFADRFRVVRLLARGGMGAVYVAEQLSTQKLRALKVMLPLLSLAERRFEQEARTSSLIDSEHVVEVIDVGVEQHTLAPWLAMELLEGEPLGAYLDRHGPLEPAETHEILRQLCHGLIAAHDLGVVHRDLKPDNVFLATSRTGLSSHLVKILDFGLAKVLERDSRNTTAMGTPLWMAPEQSDPEQVISCATDVWAVGLIAYRMLTGQPYWLSVEAGINAFFRELLVEPLQSASERCRVQGGAELPDGFDAWFARCVARAPSERYQHARDAWVALSPVLSQAAPRTDHERTLVSAPAPPLSQETPVALASTADERTARDGGPRPVRAAHRRRRTWTVVVVVGLVGALAIWWGLGSEAALPRAESGAASATTQPEDLDPQVESVPHTTPRADGTPTNLGDAGDSAGEPGTRDTSRAAGADPAGTAAPSSPPSVPPTSAKPSARVKESAARPSSPGSASSTPSPESPPSQKPPAATGLPDLL